MAAMKKKETLSPDDAAGMAWWNSMTEPERVRALDRG